MERARAAPPCAGLPPRAAGGGPRGRAEPRLRPDLPHPQSPHAERVALARGGGVTLLHRRALVEAALKHRLPGIYWAREYVEAGGLMTYGASLADRRRHAAIYVDKILRGATPADLPIEQPTTFDLVINLKTAKALGLTIPPSLLLRADQVIE